MIYVKVSIAKIGGFVMSELLIISDEELDLSFIDRDYDFLNIRKDGDWDHMMKVFEEQDPSRTDSVREAIKQFDPQEIIVIGEMEEYGWLATIITSMFGKFNAWLGQYDNRIGKTEINVNNRNVPLLALYSIEDWSQYNEK